MRSKLLVLNAGSSSLKYKIFPMEGGVGAPIVSGLAEIGRQGRIIQRKTGSSNKVDIQPELKTHKEALECVIDLLCDPKHGGLQQKDDIQGIGHRVVHGGERFQEAVLITPTIVDAIKDHVDLAPLHNPANIMGIQVAQELFGESCPQVAVFDTAFHSTMLPASYLYALPYELYEKHQIRRYGFHGTSHSFVTNQAAKILNKPVNTLNIITCHLGNGSSMAAIKDGKCIDTTMGLTPLEGLVMGTRSGDIDPAIHMYLANHLKMSVSEIDALLNKKSGLLGLCGDQDVRTIQDRINLKQDPQAQLALDVCAHRIRKYLGAYMLQMPAGLDAIVFTAGIGESSSMLRARVCSNLSLFGIELDESKNESSKMGKGPIEINSSNSEVKVLVIPTDEELSIAEQTYKILQSKIGIATLNC